MAIFVGIDEAGFGPLLGPLVVSSSAFRVPNEYLNKNMWQLLSRSLSPGRKYLAGRLLVADSKKVYNRKDGIKHLERTVLAAARCAEMRFDNLHELLDKLCPECISRLEVYPWYRDIGAEQLCFNDADVGLAARVLKADMARNNIEILGLRSVFLDVGHYNKLIRSVGNKASVLLTATSQLIARACEAAIDEDLQIIVDRQGGRMRYTSVLRRMFEQMELRVLLEKEHLSSYELTGPKRRVRIHFVVDGDEKYLPVSLASMVGKYLRELMVGLINRYFLKSCPRIRPTAGYWKDGMRFISEISRYPNIKPDKDLLVRCR